MTATLRKMPYKRDFYAGSVVILLGLGTFFHARNYAVGSLQHMGPGFFPLTLGCLLMAVGITIAGTAAIGDDATDIILLERKEWLGWACIIASPILFIILGDFVGMIPATFACVFVAALGDRSAAWKSAFVLALIVTAFGVVLFHYFLQVPFPLLRGTTI